MKEKIVEFENEGEKIKGMGHAFWDEKGIIKREDFIDKTVELTVNWFKQWLK